MGDNIITLFRQPSTSDVKYPSRLSMKEKMAVLVGYRVDLLLHYNV